MYRGALARTDPQAREGIRDHDPVSVVLDSYSWQEESIARDYAAGRPLAAIVASYGLSSESILWNILAKPRVAKLIQAYKEEINAAAVQFAAKKRLAANLSLDQLSEYIANAEITDSKANSVRQWFVDLESRSALRAEEAEESVDHRSVSMDVVLKIEQCTEPLLKQKMITISPEDQHLHSGQEFMAQRDRQLAALGSGPGDGDGSSG